MNCPFEDNLFLYLEGELSSDKTVDFEKHLNECSLCKENLTLMENFEENFNSSIPLPKNFTEQVMNKLPEPSHSNIIYIVLSSLLFILLYFIPGQENILPYLGEFLVKIVMVLRNLPLDMLIKSFMSQNFTFLLTYTGLIMAFTVYFTVKKKNIYFKNCCI